MRRLLPLCLLSLLLVLDAAFWARAGGELPVYSIQVRAVPLAERADGMATFRRLIDKGYLAYAYRVEISGETWLRIAVGVFRSQGAAAEFGRAFSAAEGIEHFITAAPVHVPWSMAEHEFVVTPSGLWVRDGSGARQIHTFTTAAPNRADLPVAILPDLSPDGQALAYVYDSYLYIATPDDGAVAQALEPGRPFVSAEADYRWRPAWSPSGDFVAFLDQAFWEYPIGLWVARADGGGQMCLACNRDGQSAVKWFVWHPSADRVLFVEGFAYGTVAVGGRLYSAEMDGTIAEVSAVNRTGNDEIAGPLWIEDGHLHYRRVRWLDDNFEDKAIIDESIPVDAL